ncbi:MAG TPA: MFS transporter [Micromonosporaceae bacterium]|nr:MFS transporter [Micromonosporaceae bacterium]
MPNLARSLSGASAFRFVLIMGVVDLFGDTTYSGGASMNGLFLASLGAGAAAVSIIGGLSEFLNYLTRGVSGYVADKIGRHWRIVFAGYVVNLLAVPAVALAGYWQVAAGLILLQGIGRGTRKPIVQAMLSYTTGQHGRGWVYGVNTALDHAGRTIGPLAIALVLLFTRAFRAGYGLLLIPAVLALALLTVARIGYPVPAKLEHRHPTAIARGFTRSYWLYLVAGACFAAGLMNFELISFHLSRSGATREVVPLFLALATGVSSVVSLALGRLYDRIGLPAVLIAVLMTAMFSPLVFLLPLRFALIGMVLWGVGQVTQDMLLSAVIAGSLPANRRNLAFGLYYAGYGLGWVIGAVTTGLLYERSLIALVIFAAGVQVASLPVFALARRLARPVGPRPA